MVNLASSLRTFVIYANIHNSTVIIVIPSYNFESIIEHNDCDDWNDHDCDQHEHTHLDAGHDGLWLGFCLLHPTNPTQVDRLTCEKLHDILNSAGKWKATPQTAVSGQRSHTNQGQELAWWIVHNHLISLIVQCCSLTWPFPNAFYKSPQ